MTISKIIIPKEHTIFVSNQIYFYYLAFQPFLKKKIIKIRRVFDNKRLHLGLIFQIIEATLMIWGCGVITAVRGLVLFIPLLSFSLSPINMNINHWPFFHSNGIIISK